MCITEVDVECLVEHLEVPLLLEELAVEKGNLHYIDV